MKTPTKVLLITLTTAVIVATVAWIGTFLYWHVRITSALRVMEANLPGQMTPLSWPAKLLDAQQVLESAGCRALPYYVGAVEPTQDLDVLDYFIAWVVGGVTSGPGENDVPNYDLSDLLLERFMIGAEDPPPVRREKCERLQAWWRTNGSRVHQWWRVWSSRCPRH